VCIIHTKNQGTSIKGALVIRVVEILYSIYFFKIQGLKSSENSVIMGCYVIMLFMGKVPQ